MPLIILKQVMCHQENINIQWLSKQRFSSYCHNGKGNAKIALMIFMRMKHTAEAY
jgi:hypothetical protein